MKKIFKSKKVQATMLIISAILLEIVVAFFFQRKGR